MPDHSDARSKAERVDLEVKLSFLERTVEGLNEVILEQGRSLRQLETRCAQLERAIKVEAGEAHDEVGPQDDPPPHY